MNTPSQIPYTIIRSTRARHLRLTVRSAGAVTVTLPRGLTLDHARYFVAKKAQWIFHAWERLRRQPVTVAQPRYPSYASSKEQAREKILEAIERWNSVYDFSYNRVSVKRQSTRWGSCSKLRNLNFNYKLLFLPQALLDYVVVHELCHLEELNHSRAFWNLVARAVPDYRVRRRELRKHSSR